MNTILPYTDVEAGDYVVRNDYDDGTVYFVDLIDGDVAFCTATNRSSGQSCFPLYELSKA